MFYFTKVRDVKSPTRGTPESAGIDFFVPTDFEERELHPNETILIHSGIKCAYPSGHALIFFNKSSIATKKMLIAMACVCDSDYQGEIIITLANVGKDSQRILPNDKIAQFLLVPVEIPTPIEIQDETELWSKWSEMRNGGISKRGIGGFGSTNKR